MVIDNNVLIESKKFIEKINALFVSHNILTISDKDDDSPPWDNEALDDDIPF